MCNNDQDKKVCDNLKKHNLCSYKNDPKVLVKKRNGHLSALTSPGRLLTH